jgi:hypothetical protein
MAQPSRGETADAAAAAQGRVRVDWARVQSELAAVDDAFKASSSRFDASPHVGRVLSSPDPDKELALVRHTASRSPSWLD